MTAAPLEMTVTVFSATVVPGNVDGRLTSLMALAARKKALKKFSL